jgi:hypothetical protein
MIYGLEIIARMNELARAEKPAKPLVYIASPYTGGDVGVNVRCSIAAMVRLISEDDCIPISPLSLSHLAHIVYPLDYETWMRYDFDLIARCDAVLRINAELGGYFQSESPGADREVEHAISLGKAVLHGMDELEEWLARRNGVVR